jgi:hypothetical protein
MTIMTTTTTTTTAFRRMTRSAVALAIGALLVSGAACDRGGGSGQPANPPAAPTAPPKPPTPDVTPKAGPSGVDVSSSSGSGGDANGSAVAKAPATVPTQATQPSAAPAAATAAMESAKRTKEAQDLVTRAMQAVKDNHLDVAKTSLDKVDAMGDTIPVTIREQATTVRHSLGNAQKLQKGPDLPDVDKENK